MGNNNNNKKQAMSTNTMTLLLLCAAMAIAIADTEMKETNDVIVPESANTADVVRQLRQEVASLRTELQAHKQAYDEFLQTANNCCSAGERVQAPVRVAADQERQVKG